MKSIVLICSLLVCFECFALQAPVADISSIHNVVVVECMRGPELHAGMFKEKHKLYTLKCIQSEIFFSRSWTVQVYYNDQGIVFSTWQWNGDVDVR
jgi:hypothetical protein